MAPLALNGTWLLALGDSLTAGGFGSVPYGATLGELLGVQVVVQGVWGEPTDAMLQRMRALGMPRSGAVLVLAGTNDLKEAPEPVKRRS